MVRLTQAKGEVEAFDPDWEEVSAHWPPRASTKAVTDQAFLACVTGQSKRSAHGLVTPVHGAPATPFLSTRMPGTPGLSALPASPSSSSASSSSSRSTSASSSASGSVGHRPAGCALQWLLSRGALGHLHLNTCDSEGTTKCGRILNRAESGTGIQDAIATGRPWSPRCFANLPAEVREALAQATRP